MMPSCGVSDSQSVMYLCHSKATECIEIVSGWKRVGAKRNIVDGSRDWYLMQPSPSYVDQLHFDIRNLGCKNANAVAVFIHVDSMPS